MRHRPIWILIIFAVGCSGAQDQWLDHPAPGVPRTRDGKVNLSAAAPRASDGKPDLSGVWQTNGSTPLYSTSRTSATWAQTAITFLSVLGDCCKNTYSSFMTELPAHQFSDVYYSRANEVKKSR